MKMVKPTKMQRRLVVPNEAEVKKAIKNWNGGPVPEAVERAILSCEVNIVLGALIEISYEESESRIDEALLRRLKPEFAMLGVNTVCEYAESWLKKAAEVKQSARNIALLLDQLVCSVNLLLNKKLCDLLKSELPCLHSKFFASDQRGVACILSHTLFCALAVEASYSDGADLRQLENAWLRLLDVEGTERSPYLMLCSFLLTSLLKVDCSKFLCALMKLDNELLEISENINDRSVCVRSQFFALLLQNWHSVATRCGSSEVQLLLRALVNYHVDQKSLHLLIAKIYGAGELLNETGITVNRYLIYSILQKLSEYLKEDALEHSISGSSQKVNKPTSSFGIWLSKITEVIADERSDEEVSSASNRTPEGVWGKVMSKFFDHMLLQSESYRIDDVDDRIRCALAALFSAVCPLESFQAVVRAVLLGSALQLLTILPSSFHSLLLSSATRIFSTDCEYFRDLLARCGCKLLLPLAERVMKRAENLECPHLLALMKECFISSADVSTLIEKGAVFLRNLVPEDQAHSRALMLNVLCDVACNPCLEVPKNDMNEYFEYLTVLSSYIIPRIIELNGAEVGTPGFEVFLRYLKPLHLLLQAERRLKVNLVPSNVVDDVIRVCKEICTHPERFEREGCIENEEMKRKVMKMAVEFFVYEGKLSRLMKWKYLINIARYAEEDIDKILLDSSFEELEALFKSRLPNGAEEYVLNVCVSVGSLQNERKRKVLFGALDELYSVMSSVSGSSPIVNVRLARVLLQQVSATDRERELVSFVLAFIVVAFPFLHNLNQITDKEAEFLLEIEETLTDCLWTCPSSVTNDQCALYAQLVSCVARAIQRYTECATHNVKLAARLSHGIAKTAQAIASQKASFARIAPFIVSECLRNPKPCILATHRLLGLCDRYGTALLTATLSPAEKRQFAALYPQYHRASEFTA